MNLRHVSWLTLAVIFIHASAWAQAVSIRPDALIGTNAQVICGVAATQVLAANARRRSFTVTVPVGGITVFYGFTAGVTAANGYSVAAGGALNDDTYIGAFWCISSGIAQNTSVLETAR